MMLNNFEALNNHLFDVRVDVRGVEYSAKDYFENYDKGMKR